MSFVGIKLLGLDLRAADTVKKHIVGSRAADQLGTVYVYAEASDDIEAGDPVALNDADFGVEPSGNAGVVFGVAPYALASGEFGWVAVQGLVTGVKAATGLIAGATIGLLTNASGQVAAGADTGNGQSRRGIVGTNEASNLASVYLF